MPFSQKMFLSLDLFIMTLCNPFVINGTSFAQIYFLLKETCLLKIQKFVAVV